MLSKWLAPLTGSSSHYYFLQLSLSAICAAADRSVFMLMFDNLSTQVVISNTTDWFCVIAVTAWNSFNCRHWFHRKQLGPWDPSSSLSLCPSAAGKSIWVNFISVHLLISFYRTPKANRFSKFLSPVAKEKNQTRVRERRGVCWFLSDAICCDTSLRFYLFACRQSRAGGILWIARCLIWALEACTPTSPPTDPESPVVILVWLQREREAVRCPLELCKHLWVLPSSEGEGWKRRGGHRCCAEREYAQRCNAIPEPTAQPPCQPLSQAAGLISPALAPTCWHRQPLLSHSRSWQDLRELAWAPDVRCGVGRPLPDGHLVAKLALRLHHVCIIPPSFRAAVEKGSAGCAVRTLYVRGRGAKLCGSSHDFQRRFVICAVRVAAFQEASDSSWTGRQNDESSHRWNIHIYYTQTALFNLHVNRPSLHSKWQDSVKVPPGFIFYW